MLKSVGLLALCCMGFASVAAAEGCALAGGEAVAEIEAMNQRMLEQDFPGFAKAVNTRSNMTVDGALSGVAKVYNKGFSGCTTLVQRRDAGGLLQSVVMFESEVGPLFVYFRSASIDGKFMLLSFYLNNEMEKVMERLR